MKPGFSTVAILLFSCLGASAALSPEQLSQLPPPAAHPVDFFKEVKPVFEASCIKCHGRGKANGGFRMDTRADFLKGGDSGTVAEIGKSAESYVIEMVSGLNPDNVMPDKGTRLTAKEVGILRAWIDQGMKWDEAVSFGKLPPQNLEPREPKISGLKKGVNPIDAILAPYYSQHRVRTARTVDDTLFARRAFFDIVGLPPSPEELDAFLADTHPRKRERLALTLLGVEDAEAADEKALAENRHRYAQHWLTFWNDALRNYYKGPGDIDSGRKAITGWLYSALATNKPYNQFVAELVNPNEYSEGFARGIVWRGVVNASQTPQMQAAQNISQVFMGVNLKCASCHDSFINDWTLADAYGLASIYADEALELVKCDKPTGKTADIRFIFPELGAIDAKAAKADRLRQLSDVITSKQNGRLTRTMVNRLWAKLMGRGLVEPVDEMDGPAWNTDLLDWLAEDFVRNGYDLKHTIAQIVTSRAYQLPSVARADETEKEYVFAGPVVRRLSGEQLVDSISAVTGAWNDAPANTDFNFYDGSGLSDLEKLPAQAHWIWSEASAAKAAAPGRVFFRKVLDLPEIPDEASLAVSADNSYTIYVNGANVSSGSDFSKPKVKDIRSNLVKGRNVFAVSAVNDAAKVEEGKSPDNPAGLWMYVRLRRHTTPVESVWDFGTDRSWTVTKTRVDQWEKPETAWTNTAYAEIAGEINTQPWALGSKLAQTVSCLSVSGEVRSSLVNADPLITALGRPNREQVTTTRPSTATTLQALELTNGSTLAQLLQRGAGLVYDKDNADPEKLIRSVFSKALARQPSREELAMAKELVGAPAKKEGVEDLLWSVAMLPEFQLIY